MAAARNVVLVGMPGAGKSTVGVLVAKHLGLGFVDTDILIQERAGRRLQEILDAGGGYLALRRLEEEAILALRARGVVVATGGSAVYSARAMAHLARGGTIVYLRAPRALLEARIDDYDRRGIANPAGQPFAEIYAERTPLYERYAQATVDVAGRTQEQVARAVTAAVAAARAVDRGPPRGA